MAAWTTWVVASGRSKMVWPGDEWGVQAWGLVVGTGCAVVWEQFAQYVWHRVMHTPLWYGLAHKYHHRAKTPSAFDDLLIHPIEAIGFYFILFSVPLLFPTHILGFLAYFGMHGFSGVMDHSGIALSLGSWYSTRDHELHHGLVSVNFATPFMYWDRIFGTYLSPTDPRAQSHLHLQ